MIVAAGTLQPRPFFLPLFTNVLEGAFSEVRIHYPAYPRSYCARIVAAYPQHRTGAMHLATQLDRYLRFCMKEDRAWEMGKCHGAARSRK